KLYFTYNRVSHHVQLQRPATSRCFGGTSSCAVPNFTLLTTISQHRLLEKEGRLTTAFAANIGIPLRRGMFPLSHCESFVGTNVVQSQSAPVCTLLNGRLRFCSVILL